MVTLKSDQKVFEILEKLNAFLTLFALIYINLANLYLSDPKNYSTVSEYNRLANENKPENILMFIPIMLMLLVAFIYDLRNPKLAINLKKHINDVSNYISVLTISIAMLCITISLFSQLINPISLDLFANGLTAMMWLFITCFLITETMEFAVTMKNITRVVIYGLILLVIYGLFSIPDLIPSKYLLFIFTSVVYLYPKMLRLYDSRFKYRTKLKFKHHYQ